MKSRRLHDSQHSESFKCGATPKHLLSIHEARQISLVCFWTCCTIEYEQSCHMWHMKTQKGWYTQVRIRCKEAWLEARKMKSKVSN